jgi:hypothetical protein
MSFRSWPLQRCPWCMRGGRHSCYQVGLCASVVSQLHLQLPGTGHLWGRYTRVHGGARLAYAA